MIVLFEQRCEIANKGFFSKKKSYELDYGLSSKGWSVSTKSTWSGKPHDRQNKERLMQPRTRHTEEQNRARNFGQSLYRPTIFGRT